MNCQINDKKRTLRVDDFPSLFEYGRKFITEKYRSYLKKNSMISAAVSENIGPATGIFIAHVTDLFTAVPQFWAMYRAGIGLFVADNF